MVDVIGSFEWSDGEKELFDNVIDGIVDEYNAGAALRIENDEWVQFLYHEALFDFEIAADYRANAYEAFVQYMDEVYGIDWDDFFDWEGYRELYDAA